MKKLNHYNALAPLFSYPSDAMVTYFDHWIEIVQNKVPDKKKLLDDFIHHIQNKTLAQQQEYYIATFDVQAVCFLDIGYVLYEEDYNRGVFLANMKNEQRKAGNDCGSELPDHLPNMLTLLPKLHDEAFAEELIVSMMMPAIEKMIASFQKSSNVYKGMLEILWSIMNNDFRDSTFEKFNFSTREKAKSFECLPQWQNIK